VIGLAEAGGEALDFVKQIYIEALDHIEELCAPYADVIDIKISALPASTEVKKWDSKKFAGALRHDQKNSHYNPNMRQLIHVGYKLAALKMDQYFRLLDANEEIVAGCVYENIFDRHIRLLFDLK
jgi:hypothetical protein